MLVAEVNQGGDMVRAVIGEADPTVPVIAVRATRGKWLRAEPVAALYEQGRVKHVGVFPALEDEMCDFGLDGLSSGRSPDRLDALVWAVTSLSFGAQGRAADTGAVGFLTRPDWRSSRPFCTRCNERSEAVSERPADDFH